MAKFSNSVKNTTQHGPSKTSKVADTLTFNGAKGYTLDNKTALFLLAASSMVGEDTFYERAEVRDGRLKNLVHAVTQEDPEWIQRFISFLRNEMHMRSASVVVAVEYLVAGGPNARKVINDACSRADEPAEVLAYYISNYGGWDGKQYPLPAPKLPQALRKGLGDACNRLYTEKAVLKWNGNSRELSMGNVLDLVHPKTDGPNPVFKYVVDKHHGNPTDIGELTYIQNWHALQGYSKEMRRAALNEPEILRSAGMTWESLSGWLGGPMDAQAWEAMIESGMGYMALLRNLRNFEQAGVSKKYRELVINKLTNPDEVDASRQFPYRFWNAHKMLKEGGYYNYLPALEEALDLSTRNIPEFPGTTLVLVDTSGSMTWGYGYGYGASRRQRQQTASPMEIASLFGTAIAKKQGDRATLVAWSTTSAVVNLNKNASVFRGMEQIAATNTGGGTQLAPALNKHYKGQDRVVILSDFQADSGSYNVNPKIIHSFDLQGYNRMPFEIGSKGRYLYGGYSDKMMQLMPILEKFHNGNWPF